MTRPPSSNTSTPEVSPSDASSGAAPSVGIPFATSPVLSLATAQDARQPALDHVTERLRTILSDSGAAAAWEWYIADRLIVGDAGFAAMYGVTVADAAKGVTPATFFSIIHPQDRDRIRLAIGGLLRGAEQLSKEYRIVPADGRVRWVHARGRSHYNDIGQSTRFSGVLIDITEQKRLEEQLRIAQSAGGVGTFEHIDGFGTAAVSGQFCSLLGLHPAADLPLRTINSVVHAQDQPIIDVATTMEPGAVSRVEFRIVRPDNGETRWLMRRGEYLRDTETAGIRFSGVIYDITDAKHVEEQLRRLNETLESRVAERTRERDRIWRVSQDLLGVSDIAGRWISVNPAWESVLGWKETTIIGKSSEWLEHPLDQQSFRSELARFTQGLRPLSFENRLRGRDGCYRWLAWTAALEEGLFYCVGRDITAEKEAALALSRAEEQLRQSQKMEAVEQLTGGLAHDFNNLLTSINGSLELLQSRVAEGLTSGLDSFIAAAQGAAKRAAALTHRLLAFSRRQTLSPKPTDLNRLIGGMEDLIRRTMGPQVAIDVVVAEDLCSTLVDPNQLENALLNLTINARDAISRGGRLTIEPGNTRLDDAAARERDLDPGEYVTLRVSDTGTGMSPEVISRAFDPFFTTKPIGQGTGLGLSMIYGFARQSGGQVSIDSELGRGTTVSLYLPRYVGEAEIAHEPARPSDPVRAEAGETVLVVDDEPSVRMLVTAVLEDLGYATIEARDGATGLRVLQSDARIDLLVTDVGLPHGMNGRQMADAARALRPALKVLFITGYAENTVLGNDRLDQGMHVLTKPFGMDVLARRVKSIVGQA